MSNRGTANGPADGPRIIYGLVNRNWAGPDRANEGADVSSDAKSAVSDFYEDDSDKKYDAAYDQITDLLDDYITPEMEDFISFRSFNDRDIDKDDAISDYAYAISEGDQSETYMIVDFDRGDELQDQCNKESIGLTDGTFRLPEGWTYTDNEEIQITMDAFVNGDQDQLQELKDNVQAAAEYGVIDSALYSSMFDEAARKCISDTDIRITISDLVDSDLEVWEEDNPEENFDNPGQWYEAREEKESELYNDYENRIDYDSISEAFTAAVNEGEIDMSDVAYNPYAKEFNLLHDDAQKVFNKILDY